jgi:hypothetical protein
MDHIHTVKLMKVAQNVEVGERVGFLCNLWWIAKDEEWSTNPWVM